MTDIERFRCYVCHEIVFVAETDYKVTCSHCGAAYGSLPGFPVRDYIDVKIEPKLVFISTIRDKVMR